MMMGDLGPARPGCSLVLHKAEKNHIEGVVGAASPKRQYLVYLDSQNLHCQFQSSKTGDLQQMWVFRLQSLY